MSMDVLFISPPSPKPTSWAFFQNVGSRPLLGIGYIMAVLETRKYTTDVLNCYLGIRDVNAFRRRIRQSDPKIVGITCSTDTYKNALLLAKIIKQLNQDIQIVVGGPHVTFTDRDTLKHDCIDYVVRHEGEFSMLELADCIIRGEGDIQKIHGISYRIGDKIVRNPSRKLIGNLDSLPVPKRIASNGNMQTPDYVGIISSRGCPGRCIFCSAGAMSGGQYRMRSATHVFDEILYYYKKNIYSFKFYDDTLTADINRLNTLCDLMGRIHLHWSAESRVDVVSEDKAIFRKMSKAGCQSLQFGIESGSDRMLDKIQKGITRSQIEEAVSLASREDIRIFGSMIIGHPEDTFESVRETIQFGLYLQSKYEAGIIFGIATPFPGTFMMKESNRLGIRILTRDYNQYNFSNPVISGRYLTDVDRRNLLYEACYELMQGMPMHWRKLWKATL